MHVHVAIFMEPESTVLSVRVATTKDPDETINAPALPPNQQTNVRVEAVEKEVFVFYNSSLVAIMTMTGKRISGNAKRFTSDPWYSPAKAKVSSIRMTAISKFSSRPIEDFTGPVSTGVAYEKTYVPPDFAISFNITPKRLVTEYTNIIRYTQDNTNHGGKGRIPGRFYISITYYLMYSSNF